MSEPLHCGFVNPRECRELLIRIDQRTAYLDEIVRGRAEGTGLVHRVDALEQDRDEKKGQIRALAILGGGGGIIGILTAIWHFFIHKL